MGSQGHNGSQVKVFGAHTRERGKTVEGNSAAYRIGEDRLVRVIWGARAGDRSRGVRQVNKLGGKTRAAGNGRKFVKSGDLPCGLGAFRFIGNRQMRENALDAHQPCGFKFKGTRH